MSDCIRQSRTAKCTVCGDIWAETPIDSPDDPETFEKFKEVHKDCQSFYEQSVKLMNELGWSKYQWGEFYDEHLAEIGVDGV